MRIECCEVTEKERLRLLAPSEDNCPCCGEVLSIGEAEAGGICAQCYFVIGDRNEH